MNPSSKSKAFVECCKISDLATPAQRFQSNYNSTKESYFMGSTILVDEQDIINTYSKGEQFSCKKHFEYKKLIKENPKYGYKRCAKLLGVPQGRTRWWHTKGKKNAVPLALKAVQKLKDAKLLPFTENHKDVKIIFNMLGILFGDGGVDKRLNTVAFISADIRDINFWKKDFLKNSLLLNLNSRVILLSLGNGIDFLGYITRPWSIYVRKRVIINFKKKIKDYNKLVEKGELDEDDKKQFRAIKASYFGHFKHANCFRIRKELLCLK